VVALFDRLVQAIPVLRRAVGRPEGVLHQAADQNRLEVQADLGDVGLAPHADLDLPLKRLRLIPGVAAQRVGRRQDPALVVVDDSELRRVPVDVRVRIEVPPH
jgi:hypothetical protein